MMIETIRYNISSRVPTENEEAAKYIADFTGCGLDTAKKRLSEGKIGFFHCNDLSHKSNRKIML